MAVIYRVLAVGFVRRGIAVTCQLLAVGFAEPAFAVEGEERRCVWGPISDVPQTQRLLR